MQKFLSFWHKFAAVIMMILGIVIALIMAGVSGIAISDANAWGKPSEAVASVVIFSISVGALGLTTIFGFLSLFVKGVKWLSNFGKFIIMSISFLLLLIAAIASGIAIANLDSRWTSFPDVISKLNISLFSISLIILGMYVIFGIITAGYRAKVKKAKNSVEANY